jgi:hypothetical protein
MCDGPHIPAEAKRHSMHGDGLERTDATDARPGKVEGIWHTRTGRRGGDGDSTLRPIMLIEREPGLAYFIFFFEPRSSQWWPVACYQRFQSAYE